MEYSTEEALDEAIKVLIDNEHHQVTFEMWQDYIKYNYKKVAMLHEMIPRLKRRNYVTEEQSVGKKIIFHPTLEAIEFIRDGGYTALKKEKIKSKRIAKWSLIFACIAAVVSLITIALYFIHL